MFGSDNPFLKYIRIAFAAGDKPGANNVFSDDELGIDSDDDTSHDTSDDNDIEDVGDDDNSNDEGETRQSKGSKKDESFEDTLDKNYPGLFDDKKGGGKKDAKAQTQKKDSNQNKDTPLARRPGESDKNHRGAENLRRYIRTKLAEDQQGNLIDPQTKQLVVRAGAERFYFEQARHGINQFRNVTDKLNKAVEIGKRIETELNTYKSMDKSGLSMDDHSMAIKLFGAYRKDPEATLKYILTEASTNGIDLKKIIGPNAGLDTAALKSIVQSELKPFTDERKKQQQAQQTQAQQEQQLTNYVNQFFDRYPDAEVHEESIAKLMTGRGMEPVDAYYALKAWVEKNGLDWSQPLQPQLAKLRQRSTPNNRNRRPLPQGRNMRRVVEDEQQNNDASMGANARTDDIVREAMREAGLNV